MFKVRPQTPHTHLQLAATSKIKEFPSKNECNSWNVPKGFYRKKLHLIQHLLWILRKEDGSLFTRKAHTSGTTTMWSQEPFVWTWLNPFPIDCNSAQLTNQLPILVTATWTWLMYSVLYQPTRIIKINDKKKKNPTKIPRKGKIKQGKMQKRVTQCKAVWCRHKSD